MYTKQVPVMTFQSNDIAEEFKDPSETQKEDKEVEVSVLPFLLLV